MYYIIKFKSRRRWLTCTFQAKTHQIPRLKQQLVFRLDAETETDKLSSRQKFGNNDMDIQVETKRSIFLVLTLITIIIMDKILRVTHTKTDDPVNVKNKNWPAQV